MSEHSHQNMYTQHLYIYVCVVSSFSRVWINRVWLPILLEVSWTTKIKIFPILVRAWEFGLARRVRPSCPASARSLTTLRLNVVLTRGLLSFVSFSTTAFIYTVNCHRANSKFIRSRICVPMAFIGVRIIRLLVQFKWNATIVRSGKISGISDQGSQ